MQVKRQNTQLVVKKLNFCGRKPVRVVGKNSSQLAVQKLPNSCSEKARHATRSGKLDFAVEKQCVWWEK
jgi:hypothetical protein